MEKGKEGGAVGEGETAPSDPPPPKTLRQTLPESAWALFQMVGPWLSFFSAFSVPSSCMTDGQETHKS